MTSRVAVIGEALIDLLPGDASGQFVARAGGSPFNVAVGLARLEVTSALVARLGRTAFGQLLRARATAENIDLAYSVESHESTTLAVVALGPDGDATYDFYLEGTSDWQWTDDELRTLPPVEVVHFGSLASWLEPGASAILSAVKRHAGLVTYDPNVRPGLLAEPESARPKIEAGVQVSHLVKASREDVSWLYPDEPVDAVAARWKRLGPGLVVITDGAAGAFAFRGADSWTVAAPAVTVVDTVGAGDAFTAGLIAGLLQRGVNSPTTLIEAPVDVLTAAVADGALVAALTCAQPGADPPTAAQPEAARSTVE